MVATNGITGGPGVKRKEAGIQPYFMYLGITKSGLEITISWYPVPGTVVLQFSAV